MNAQQEIQEIDKSIQEARVTVELGNALARLQSNRDFKKVIETGYFKDEAVRLVHLLSDPNMQTPEKQQAILSDIRAVGALKNYLGTVSFLANVAKKSIAFSEEVRDELIEGGDDGR